MNTEKVYKVMDSALEQYRLNKSDVNFGRAWGAANLAFELSIITFDQFNVYIESLIWEKNNSQLYVTEQAECLRTDAIKTSKLPFPDYNAPI